MICKECGAELHDEAIVCIKCGYPTSNYNAKESTPTPENNEPQVQMESTPQPTTPPAPNCCSNTLRNYLVNALMVVMFLGGIGLFAKFAINIYQTVASTEVLDFVENKNENVDIHESLEHFEDVTNNDIASSAASEDLFTLETFAYSGAMALFALVFCFIAFFEYKHSKMSLRGYGSILLAAFFIICCLNGLNLYVYYSDMDLLDGRLADFLSLTSNHIGLYDSVAFSNLGAFIVFIAGGTLFFAGCKRKFEALANGASLVALVLIISYLASDLFDFEHGWYHLDRWNFVYSESPSDLNLLNFISLGVMFILSMFYLYIISKAHSFYSKEIDQE
jgi:hypothetical protein